MAARPPGRERARSRPARGESPWRRYPLAVRAPVTCLLIGLLGSVAAHADDGQALYLSECSKCHGFLDSSGAASPARPAVLQVASLHAGADDARGYTPSLAFALPYGPSLRGIVGRAAGSVPGYDYSKAFRTALQGVVWDAAGINVYLQDSQARAPGARMFYRQPDATIRERIIEYLSLTN